MAVEPEAEPAGLGAPGAAVHEKTTDDASISLGKAPPPGKALPPGNGPPPGRAPPPGKAPPPRKAPPGKAPPGKAPPGKAPGGPPSSGSSLASDLPSWQGPRPAEDLKAVHMVNWQPIRNASRFTGSVWERVNESVADGSALIPDSVLNDAFMCNAQETPKAAKVESKRVSVIRRFPRDRALTVDLNHAILVRNKIRSPGQLRWISGPRSREGEPSDDLPEKALEALRCLLEASVGQEAQLGETASAGCSSEWVPAEAFVRDLLVLYALGTLRLHVDMALLMARFAEKAAVIRTEIDTALCAVSAVLDSSTIPVLLEGVLLLGNYVNASSRSLGGAVGVTLESLAKLAHTRCRVAAKVKGGREQQGNALCVLVMHLQQTRPSFIETLAGDLDTCRTSKDFDPKAAAAEVRALAAQVDAIEKYREKVTPDDSSSGGEAESCPDALAPELLREFLTRATPEMTGLQALLEELTEATAALRRWLAEPSQSELGNMLGALGALRDALPKTANTTLAAKRRSRRPTRSASSISVDTSKSEAGDKDAEESVKVSELSVESSEEAPYGVVAQILSVSKGKLWLSWCFDWGSVPEAACRGARLARGFEVLQLDDAIDVASAAHAIRRPCGRPPLELDVPVGVCYSFRVRAVLSDAGVEDGGDRCLEPEWSSKLSLPVSADLRGVAGSAAQPPATGSVGSSASGSGPPPVARRSGGVASSLEAYLQGRKLSDAGAAPPPPPPAAAQSASSGSAVKMAPPAVRASPLAMENPRVSVAGPLDPVQEKREVAERLRTRSGVPLVAVSEEPCLEPVPDDPSTTPWPQEFDLDDDFMLHLSRALTNFEKSRVTPADVEIEDEGSVPMLSTSSRERRSSRGGRLAMPTGEVLEDDTDSGPIRPRAPPEPTDCDGDDGALGRLAKALGNSTPEAASPDQSRGLSRPEPTPEPTPEANRIEPPGTDFDLGRLSKCFSNLERMQSKHASSPLPFLASPAWASPSPVWKSPAAQRAEQAFRLAVVLQEEGVGTLEFHADSDIPELVQQFVERSRLRPIFADPLVEHATQLLREGRQEESVDLMDLL